jgi:PAS domain S-box-containing protein
MSLNDLTQWEEARPSKGRSMRLDTLVQVTGGAVCLLGLLVMVAWHLGLDSLIRPTSTSAPMQHNTAMCFFLVGIALVACSSGRFRMGAVIAMVAGGVGLLTWLQYLLDIDLRIDSLLVEPHVTVRTSHPGRMPPNTGLSFVVLAAALLARWLWRDRPIVGAVLGSVVLGLGGVALLLYLAGVEDFLGWGGFTRMAIHTSVAFTLCGLSLVTMSWRDCSGYDRDIPVWFAYQVGLGALCITLVLWQALLSNRRELLEAHLNEQVDEIQSYFETVVDSHLLALRRMADRWHVAGGTEHRIWSADATQYIADQSGLRELVWRDSQGAIGWRERSRRLPDTNGIVRPNEIHWTSLEQFRLEISDIIDLTPSGHGFWVRAPLFIDGRSDGHLLALYHLEELFETMLRGAEPDLTISMLEDGLPVYRREGRGGDSGSPLVRTVGLGYLPWTISAEPGREFISMFGAGLPSLALFFGLFVSLLLTVAIRGFRRNHIATMQVQGAKRELEEEIAERRRVETECIERAKLAELISRVANTLNEQRELRAALQGCCEGLVEHADAAFARVWTLNESGDTLELQASAGIYTHIDGGHARVPVGSFKIGLIAQERAPHLTNSVQSDPRIGDPEWAKREGMVSFAGYPLIVQDRVVGVMALFARHPLAQTVLDALDAIADGVAIAIDQRRAEAAFQESQRSKTALIENLPGMVYRCLNDRQWTMLFVSDGSTRLTGYSPAHLLENGDVTYGEIIHEEDRESVWTQVQEAVARRDSYQMVYRIHTRDGQLSWAWEQGRGHFGDDGNLLWLEGYIADVSKVHRAETENARFLAAIEQTAESVIVTDIEGTIQYVNPRFEEETGYGRHEICGQNTRILKSGQHDPKFYADMWRTILAGGTWSGLVTNRRKDGSLYEIHRTISPVRDAGGGIVNFVATGRDTSKERLLESQLRQSQKMEAVGQLAGGVAHDFNNLMQAVLGFTGFAIQSVGSDHPAQHDLMQIRVAGERAASLTRRLLAFSRKQELNATDVELNELVTNLLKMLRRLIGENIELEFHPKQAPATVQADPSQIEQILMNLLLNSRDAMPDGGHVTIETSEIEIGEEFVRSHPWARLGRFEVVTVTDTGSGMDKETLERVFEPFFTTKELGKGTGLGLATVYGIVKQHNGMIHVYSEPGCGTSFKIYIPSHSIEAEALANSSPEIPTGGSETILLAEDEEMVRELAVRILEGAGYRVLQACNGAEAVKALEEHLGEIDLAVLDVVMPKISGQGVWERAQALCPDLSVIFTSGYSENTLQMDRVRAAGLQLIGKPYDADTLLSSIRKVMTR